MSEPRVLIVAHGHPDFSLGGGEIAAHAHWAELRRRGLESMLVARTSLSPRHAGASFSMRSGDPMEVLFSAPPVDHFRHSQPDGRVIYDEFRSLLERFRPNVVHFHHYVHLGLEMIREVRRFAPGCRIVVTLHEFLAMCHAQGQMLKTNGVLCGKAAPLDCHGCFPNIAPQDFFLRELFVKSFLNLVDRFVCPSVFLRDRYIEWGLPPEKMVVLENGQPTTRAAHSPQPAPPAQPAPPPQAAKASLRTKFISLGQLSRLKGSFVLLEAARLLPRVVRKRILIEIHGSMQYELEDFRARYQSALAGLEDVVRYCGPYRPGDVHDIIERSGWVIQPSIWWENSPLVIQEAFAAGRPVICSNVGGMAEKVTHGVSGLHFRVGSAIDLAARIEEAATTPGLWERLCAGTPRPPTISDTVDRLLTLYSGDSGDPPEPAPTRRVRMPHMASAPENVN
jgi:glycosyltransferase involved in cell wall biosynthesis